MDLTQQCHLTLVDSDFAFIALAGLILAWQALNSEID